MAKFILSKKESNSKNYLHKIIPRFYSFRQQLVKTDVLSIPKK